jgi:hypothetical protein
MFALPICLYLVALLALRLHLPTGETTPLVVALLAGLLAVGSGVGLVMRHRVPLERVSSRG